MFDDHGRRQKLVVFTEHRDTMDYLVSRIRSRIGRPEDVALIHGGMGRDERRREQDRFVGDDPTLPEASILVATDAAGEGINLQAAHLMVNYDLPWNPNRLEQRFGRIHRFGQKHVCFNWNLVAANTREGDVYRTLFDKLEEARDALGGKVFDVLGQLFADRPLRDLLLQAIRQDAPSELAKVEHDLELVASLAHYREVIARQALAKEILGPEQMRKIRAERHRAEVGRLVPHFVAGFFVDALREIGGVIEEREAGRFVISSVPLDLRRRGRETGAPLSDRYSRVCFDKIRLQSAYTNEGDDRGKRNGHQGKEVTLVAPGHPLFDMTIELLLERHGDMLSRGAILVDPRPGADVPRILVATRSEIVDERTDRNGRRRVAGAELRFVEVTPNGEVQDVGAAPYLDYRPLDATERGLIAPLLTEPWLRIARGVAEAHAAEHFMPPHLARVKDEREEFVTRARTAVDERLTGEMLRLTDEIVELRRQERDGRQLKMNVDRAVRRYDDLKHRRERRLRDLNQELRLTPQPPRSVASALVVPMALIAELQGDEEPAAGATATRRIEELAMRAAIARERAAGYIVHDVSKENRGYDLESIDQRNGALRLVEVKGRDIRGETVVLTRNEYLVALNKGADYVLVIVQIDGEDIRAYHAIPDPLRRTTEEGLPFGLEATTFAIADLVCGADGA